MLVEELTELMRLVLADYSNLKLRTRITAASDTLSNKAHQAYRDLAVREQTALLSMLRETNPDLDSERWVHLFDGSQYQGLLPKQIIVALRGMVAENSSVAANSNETLYLLSRFDQAVSDFTNFVNTSAQLGIVSKSKSSEGIDLVLAIPANLIDGKLSQLGIYAERFDHFFGMVSEYTAGQSSKPRITHLSMTDLSIFLAEGAAATLTLLKVLQGVCDAAKSYYDARTAAKQFSNLGGDEKEYNRLIESMEEKIFTTMESRLKELATETVDQRLIARRNEIEARLFSASRWVIKQTAQGVVIEPTYMGEETVRRLSGGSEDPQDEDTVRKLLTDQRELRDIVRRKTEGEGKFVLAEIKEESSKT